MIRIMVEPDAVKIECQTHCQKQGVNLYDGEHLGDRYGDGYRRTCFMANIGCDEVYVPLYSIETLKSLFRKVDCVEELLEKLEGDN